MQNYVWPAVSVTATNPSVGINGATAPTSATLVAGINQSNGDLQPLQTNAAGSLLVAPTPGTTGDVNLTEVGGAAITLGQKTESASLPVVLPSDQVVPISATALPLPAGASTSALQTSGNASLTSINANQTNGTQTTSVLNFPATQPVSGTVTVVQPTAANLNATVVGTVTANAGTGTFAISAASLPLPTGAATSANQTNGTQVTSVNNFPATQPVSGTVTVVQPTGSNLHVDIDNFPASQVVSQPTAANLNATVVGTVNAKAATPTALTVTQTALTVGTTAVRLTVSGSAPASTRVVMVATPDALSTAKFYIGSSSVTSTSTTRGPEIVAGQSFIANNDAGDYWIVSDTAAQTVYVMEQE